MRTFHYYLVFQKVFIKLFCTSQFPDQSVNVSFIITNMKNKLTNFVGVDLLKLIDEYILWDHTITGLACRDSTKETLNPKS